MAAEKRCGKCGEFKSETEFYLLAGKYLSSYCRKCDNERRRPKVDQRRKPTRLFFKKPVLGTLIDIRA